MHSILFLKHDIFYTRGEKTWRAIFRVDGFGVVRKLRRCQLLLIAYTCHLLHPFQISPKGAVRQMLLCECSIHSKRDWIRKLEIFIADECQDLFVLVCRFPVTCYGWDLFFIDTKLFYQLMTLRICPVLQRLTPTWADIVSPLMPANMLNEAFWRGKVDRVY